MTKKAKKTIPKAKRGHVKGGAKLGVTQVREIRYLYQRGDATYGSLAREYGLSSQAIRNIVKRFSWRDLPDE